MMPVNFVQLAQATSEQDTQCTCNVTLWLVRVMLIPPRLPYQPDTISLEESAFTAI
jgi:hypothetical protein